MGVELVKIILDKAIMAAVSEHDGMTSVVDASVAKSIAWAVAQLLHLGGEDVPPYLERFLTDGSICTPELDDELRAVLGDHKLAGDDLLAINALIAFVDRTGERDGDPGWDVV